MSPRRLRPLAAVLLICLAVAACSAAGSSSDPAATGAAPVSPIASASVSPTADPSTAAAGAVRVNANTASVDELQAAFEAAGISNANRWAREVAEYRPYPADPTWVQLRQELSKYNIAPAVLEQIIAVLEV